MFNKNSIKLNILSKMKNRVRRPLWKNSSIACHFQSNFQKAKPPSDYIKTWEKEADVFLVNSTFSSSLMRTKLHISHSLEC